FCVRTARLHAIRVADGQPEHLESTTDADDAGAAPPLAANPLRQARLVQPLEVGDRVLRPRKNDDAVVSRWWRGDPIGPRQGPDMRRVRDAWQPDDGQACTWRRWNFWPRLSRQAVFSGEHQVSRMREHAEAGRTGPFLEQPDAVVEQRDVAAEPIDGE